MKGLSLKAADQVPARPVAIFCKGGNKRHVQAKGGP
jgi:hypothetical protein